jgi:hypothetical protein
MSWFTGAGVDVNDVPDNPNELPNDTYRFQVTSAVLKPTGDGSKTGITFKYQIVDGAWQTFFPLTDWVRVPDSNTKQDEIPRMLSFLKMRLLGFGFSPEAIQDFGPEMVNDCIGKTFFGTTSARKDKDGNTNIRVSKFSPIGEGSDTMIDMGGEAF